MRTRRPNSRLIAVVAAIATMVVRSASRSSIPSEIGVVSRPDDAKVRDYQITPVGARMAPADDTGTAVELVPFEPFTRALITK